jgi:phosphohistidine phosphatase SixA
MRSRAGTTQRFADHDRPLTTRGRKAVPHMAKYMRDKRLEPSVALCTSAVRARQTLELLQPVIPDARRSSVDSVNQLDTGAGANVTHA